MELTPTTRTKITALVARIRPGEQPSSVAVAHRDAALATPR